MSEATPSPRKITDVKAFLRYGVIGAAQNGVSYLLALGLVQLGLAGWMATGITFPLGVVFSFILNRQWTFNERKKGHFWRYACVYALTYPCAMASVWGLEKLGAPAWLAILLTMGAAAVALFFIINAWIFPRSRTSDAPPQQP